MLTHVTHSGYTFIGVKLPVLRPPARPELVDGLDLNQVAGVRLQPVQRLLCLPLRK